MTAAVGCQSDHERGFLICFLLSGRSFDNNLNLGSPANRAWVESRVEDELALNPDFELVITNVNWTPFDRGKDKGRILNIKYCAGNIEDHND